MIKLFLYFFTLILLVNCSVDTKSGIWENVNETKSVIKISEITFDHNLSFDKYKKNIIDYGKLSNYPKLDK
tara:strand:+ start:584 stop:796 length:213 start_codon:yes stop_codon:yes gene_type:complete